MPGDGCSDGVVDLEMGVHRSAADGMCVLEAVSVFAGEPFSDAPTCVSPVIASLLVRLNDDLTAPDRQRLGAFIPRLATSRSNQVESKRGLLAAQWLVRIHTSVWLEVALQPRLARRLQELPDTEEWDGLSSWVPVVEEVASEAWRSCARPAAPSWILSWDAARNAVRDASWTGARSAGTTSLWLPVWDGARTAARHATDACANRGDEGMARAAAGELEQAALDLIEELLAVR